MSYYITELNFITASNAYSISSGFLRKKSHVGVSPFPSVNDTDDICSSLFPHQARKVPIQIITQLFPTVTFILRRYFSAINLIRIEFPA